MDIATPKGFTRNIGAPSDWNAETQGICHALPVADIDRDGRNYMRSSWRPSPAEMVALDMGATIDLDILGKVHPVICLSVDQVGPLDPNGAARRISIAIAGAVEAMVQTAAAANPGAYLAISPCRVDATGVGVQWGIVKDPARVAPDFAHWQLIGPLGGGQAASDAKSVDQAEGSTDAKS